MPGRPKTADELRRAARNYVDTDETNAARLKL